MPLCNGLWIYNYFMPNFNYIFSHKPNLLYIISSGCCFAWSITYFFGIIYWTTYCKYIFRANPNFKEIKSDNFSELPAGSVVVYDAFDKVTYPDGSTGKVGEDGHVLIALGDGRGCSDILEDQIGYSKNAYSFIPV